MKSVSIRIDQKINEIIQRNSAQQGIKLSRYIRSLIEKGLVLDHQVRAGDISASVLQQEADVWPKILQLVFENLLLTQSLVWVCASTGEKAKDITDRACENAKKYISKHIASQESS